MGLEGRINAVLKRFGADTDVSYERREGLFEYTVTHVDGDTTTVEAHYYETDAPLVKFYEYSDSVDGWWTGNYRNVGLTSYEQSVLEGIKRIETERVAEDVWTVEADLAEGSSSRVNDSWRYTHERSYNTNTTHD